MDKVIYLDNAATTFPKPNSVYDIMDDVNRNYAVNSGRGSYMLARKASLLIEETKEKILKLINADFNSKVIFSPSITISINQVLNGLDFKSGSIIYISPYDHNAVARTLNLLQKRKNIRVRELPVNELTCEIDIDRMKYLFTKEPPNCVCSTFISNVTGYILPINDIFSEAKKYGAITVLDAAQSMGLLQMELKNLNADFVAFAGHKTLYGPFGVGGFIYNCNIKLNEFIVGGTGSDSLNLEMPNNIPNKYESASPNIIAIAGLNKAIDFVKYNNIYDEEKTLTNYLIQELGKISTVKMYLPSNLDKHISIVSFNVEGYKSEDVGLILDEDFSIAVRTGYHCSPFIHKYLKDEVYLGTVRASLSYFNSKEDIDLLAKAIKEL